jgi:hypothetical protein
MQLRRSLCAADVLTLGPGDRWEQCSSAVLVVGSLYSQGAAAAAAVSSAAVAPAGAPAASRSGGDGGGGKHSVQYRVAAPSVLAWAPELFEPMAGRCEDGVRGGR